MSQLPVNPITVEVVRNGLAHIANEMATVLRKTSYNMMIYEVRDYCVGIVDPEGNILSQNFGALPIFLADLGPAIVDGVRRYGKDGFAPGDVLIMNHPYVCGQHLNNVVIYTPFFHEGELVAFLTVRAHWIDIGGTRVGFGFSGTREVYEEGLQLRSLKLYRGDKPDHDILQIITDNVRFAESCLGDLRAQIAACRVGDRGLGALVGRYGLATFLACVRAIWHQSETLAREQVARIKPGRYEAEALFDSDGVDLDRPVPLKVKVAVGGGDMTIDFSEISEQVPGSINSGESGAVAAARVAFKSLVSPFSPIDEGCFRALKVVIPPGKILSATPPAPVGNWSRTLPTVVDLILKALAPALPDKAAAGHKGDMGGYAFFGTDPRSGRRFLCQTIMGGGWGGRAYEDGENATVSICQGDVQNAPVEMQEIYYPVLVEHHRLREGSGGAGKFRGGLGIEICVRVLCEALTNINVERQRTPPWGLFDGKCGAIAKALVKQSPEDPGVWLTKKPNYPLKKGSSVTFFTAGGGGYGPATERAPELIERDRRLGYTPAINGR
ncbi:MAG: hydantoinase B/oxoprolinase family protein [Deltaproteobacteria bacterium]|nr:hydantoinase B/oxoprolinase family protein [Deltaproteobacteria bacterium]MBI2532667.1 hydantoinase B/oxoprolinase family protein [Deltaproteobacteria bacterium]MBI3065886.1 hydantoinase B/oxoprolinase family protein [Deltaproteobacteria bacterium]